MNTTNGVLPSAAKGIANSRLPIAKRRRAVSGEQVYSRYLKGLFRLRETLRKDGEVDYELGPIQKLIDEASTKLWALRDKRLMKQAVRKDKGVVCWEVFHPRSEKPLDVGFFDTQRHVVRTPNRVFEEGTYVTIKAEWRVASGDPWTELDRELHRVPFDLGKFEQFHRDLRESLRRHKLKRNWLVKDDQGHVTRVSCETEVEALSRVMWSVSAEEEW